jgi:hypothetical protein
LIASQDRWLWNGEQIMTLESTRLHPTRHLRSEEAFAPQEMSKGCGEMMPLFKFGDKRYIAILQWLRSAFLLMQVLRKEILEKNSFSKVQTYLCRIVDSRNELGSFHIGSYNMNLIVLVSHQNLELYFNYLSFMKTHV